MLVVKEYTGPITGPGRKPPPETLELIALLQRSANERKSYEISPPDEKTRARWVAALRKHAPKLKIKVSLGTSPAGGLVVTATPLSQIVDSSVAVGAQTDEKTEVVPQGTPDVSGPTFSNPEVTVAPRKRAPRKKA